MGSKWSPAIILLILILVCSSTTGKNLIYQCNLRQSDFQLNKWTVTQGALQWAESSDYLPDKLDSGGLEGRNIAYFDLSKNVEAPSVTNTLAEFRTTETAYLYLRFYALAGSAFPDFFIMPVSSKSSKAGNKDSFRGGFKLLEYGTDLKWQEGIFSLNMNLVPETGVEIGTFKSEGGYFVIDKIIVAQGKKFGSVSEFLELCKEDKAEDSAYSEEETTPAYAGKKRKTLPPKSKGNKRTTVPTTTPSPENASDESPVVIPISIKRKSSSRSRKLKSTLRPTPAKTHRRRKPTEAPEERATSIEDQNQTDASDEEDIEDITKKPRPPKPEPETPKLILPEGTSCIETHEQFVLQNWSSYPPYLYAEDESSLPPPLTGRLNTNGIFYFDTSTFNSTCRVFFKFFDIPASDLENSALTYYLHLRFYNHRSSNSTQEAYARPVEGSPNFIKTLPPTSNFRWRGTIMQVHIANGTSQVFLEIGVKNVQPGDYFLIDKIVLSRAQSLFEVFAGLDAC